MKTNTIITIGRQFGSAGREIGYQVADYFGIKLYDKEMLSRAAKESGICEEILKHMMKSRRTAFVFSRDGYVFYGVFGRILLRYANQP